MAENTAPGLFGSLRRLLAGVVDVGRTRLQLLVNELEEEKIRLVGVLVNSILALASLIVGAVLLVVFLTVLFWENRLAVLGFASVFFIVAAFVFAGRSQAGVEKGSGLFKASLAELEADADSLKAGEAQDESPST